MKLGQRLGLEYLGHDPIGSFPFGSIVVRTAEEDKKITRSIKKTSIFVLTILDKSE